MAKHIDPTNYETDKPGFRVYFENYERIFAPLAKRRISLLELGVNRGGSLKIWRDFFPRGTIVGLDIVPVRVKDSSGRIHVYEGMQQDTDLLDRIALAHAPGGFDIIIDDCSHIGEFTAISFWHLFEKHLKPGGIFVIEDWGTGYWPSRPDGKRFTPPPPMSALRSRLRPIAERLQHNATVRTRPRAIHLVTAVMNRLVRQRFPSHDAGLVGFIKQLVDECGMDDATLPGWGTGKQRRSKFRSMVVTHGQLFITKAT